MRPTDMHQREPSQSRLQLIDNKGKSKELIAVKRSQECGSGFCNRTPLFDHVPDTVLVVSYPAPIGNVDVDRSTDQLTVLHGIQSVDDLRPIDPAQQIDIARRQMSNVNGSTHSQDCTNDQAPSAHPAEG
mgnify:CR=1 FL=1